MSEGLFVEEVFYCSLLPVLFTIGGFILKNRGGLLFMSRTGIIFCEEQGAQPARKTQKLLDVFGTFDALPARRTQHLVGA